MAFPNKCNLSSFNSALIGGELLAEEAVVERAQVGGGPAGEGLGERVGDGRAARPAQVRRRKVRHAPGQICEWEYSTYCSPEFHKTIGPLHTG